jgi:uncharacterized RDD family membrane protein YckC
MYYLWLNDAQTGPFPLEQLREWWADGTVNAKTLYWLEGMAEWTPLATIADALAKPPSHRMISGFWRRVGAYLLDALILGVPAMIVGFLLFNFFVELGVWGLLIGFCIAATYFTLLNSSWGGGQTLGKRMMGLEVVDGAGQHIPVSRSLKRYLILALPYYLNGLLGMAAISSSSLVGILVSGLVFGWGGAIAYLFVFNRRTRQSLHDLAASTYVVRREPLGEVKAMPVWGGHFAVIGAGVVLLMGLSMSAGFFFSVPFFAKLLATQQAVLATGDVRNVSLTEGTIWMTGGGMHKSTNYSVQAFMKEVPTDAAAERKKIAAIILSHQPDVANVDSLMISVSYGFNLGIASWSYSLMEGHPPAEWKKMVAGVPAT